MVLWYKVRLGFMIIMTLILIRWLSNATCLLLQEPRKYSLGYQISASLGHLEGDNPIKTSANICQKINLKPFAWQHKKYWYEDTRDIPWDIFLPCLTQFNNKRQQLLKSMMLLLDESMSGWRPKSTKLGGFPDITYGPRKPKPIFKNGVE
jgi:hypothetical protein